MAPATARGAAADEWRSAGAKLETVWSWAGHFSGEETDAYVEAFKKGGWNGAWNAMRLGVYRVETKGMPASVAPIERCVRSVVVHWLYLDFFRVETLLASRGTLRARDEQVRAGGRASSLGGCGRGGGSGDDREDAGLRLLRRRAARGAFAASPSESRLVRFRPARVATRSTPASSSRVRPKSQAEARRASC